jgi:hypothetical protein
VRLEAGFARRSADRRLLGRNRMLQHWQVNVGSYRLVFGTRPVRVPQAKRRLSRFMTNVSLWCNHDAGERSAMSASGRC